MRTAYLAAFAALGLAGLLALKHCSGTPDPAPIVLRSASGVDGFELRHSGYSGALLYPGHFSLGYAIWANYPFLIYRGEEYRRAGPGSVFVRPAQAARARYLVQETALEAEPADGYPRSELVVTDKSTGEVMARRYLNSFQREDGHGWVGQHAAEFVRKVLATGTPVGGSVGTKPYGAARASIEVLDDEVEAPSERTGADCPRSYRVDLRRKSIALDSGAWAFLPQSHLKSFACQGDYILVQSGYGNWLYLDLITASGEHLFQTDLHTRVDRNATIAVRRLRVGDGEMRIDVVYGASQERDGSAAPVRHLRATIALPPGLTRAPPAKLAVK